MNHSIYSADRSTHLKIVVVALIAGIAVAGFGISARTGSDEDYTQTARVIKAGKPMAITSANTIGGALSKRNLRNSRGSLPAPQSRLVDKRRPQLPQVTTENARSPRAFSFCGVCFTATEVRSSPFGRG